MISCGDFNNARRNINTRIVIGGKKNAVNPTRGPRRRRRWIGGKIIVGQGEKSSRRRAVKFPRAVSREKYVRVRAHYNGINIVGLAYRFTIARCIVPRSRDRELLYRGKGVGGHYYNIMAESRIPLSITRALNWYSRLAGFAYLHNQEVYPPNCPGKRRILTYITLRTRYAEPIGARLIADKINRSVINKKKYIFYATTRFL